jgi:hypothetical protein
MGTTVSTNLGLIKPDTNESVKANMPTFAGWAAQNTINMDKIDALFRATNHTWSPAWTAVTTSPTLGAGGFIEGKYLRLFPRMVIGHFRISAGAAGFLAGSGIYSLSVPATIAAELQTFNQLVPIGKAVLYDDSAVATSSVMSVLYSTINNKIYLRPADTDSWSNTNPITLAQLDRVSGYFMYPTSDA